MSSFPYTIKFQKEYYRCIHNGQMKCVRCVILVSIYSEHVHNLHALKASVRNIMIELAFLSDVRSVMNGIVRAG